ncbi:MAG: hypothetical protein ACT4P7_14625 [Gemmatimonadaceae bacterium]
MSARAGIELTPTTIRAVVAAAWRHAPARSFEVAWDPAHPESAVSALRLEHPSPDAVWMAIGLGFLHVVRVQLPPAPDEAREQMLSLEPDRFFASSEKLQVSLVPGGDVAFAVNATWLEHTIRAFEDWGPVIRVEPSPLAAAAFDPAPSGVFTIEAAPDEQGIMELREGRIVSLRRVPASTPVAPAMSLPAADGVGSAWRAAWGAMRRDDAPFAGSFLGPERRAAARRRLRWSMATAITAAVAGLMFLLFSVDRARDRSLAALTQEADRLTGVARTAIDAHARLTLSQREGSIARNSLARRPDPAATLAAIGRVLPRDVVILSAKATGNEWLLEGTSRNAAALIPLLDADERFDNVRSLAASARFRDGHVTRESFSIAFHVRPAS